MSEQSPLQSSVGVFFEWAKARLDEMAASAKVLESRLDSLDVNIRAQAEQAIAHVKQWIAEGQAQIKDVQAKGAASIAEAKAQCSLAATDLSFFAIVRDHRTVDRLTFLEHRDT